MNGLFQLRGNWNNDLLLLRDIQKLVVWMVLIASFGSRISTHMRTCPSFLGIATIGETQGVASLSGTFSIMSCVSSSVIVFVTFSRM